MDKERKLIIAGNWKMNKTVAESLDLAKGLVRELKDVTEVDIAVCPPFTALSAVSEAILDSNIRLGAQNMSEHGYGCLLYTSPSPRDRPQADRLCGLTT